MNYRIGTFLATVALAVSACSFGPSRSEAHDQRSQIIEACDYDAECALGLVCAAQPWICDDLNELNLQHLDEQ